jgi:NADPH:quinone reductase-like Zn-dependent oxidoreductase
VRVRVLAAGVSSPDLLMREGVHPETPRLPFTPGWDLIGLVDRLGAGISGIEPGHIVAALPISGAYAEFVCLPQRELAAVPSGLDAAEAVSLVLNYVTAYQMLHRSAKVRSGVSQTSGRLLWIRAEPLPGSLRVLRTRVDHSLRGWARVQTVNDSWL